MASNLSPSNNQNFNSNNPHFHLEYPYLANDVLPSDYPSINPFIFAEIPQNLQTNLNLKPIPFFEYLPKNSLRYNIAKKLFEKGFIDEQGYVTPLFLKLKLPPIGKPTVDFIKSFLDKKVRIVNRDNELLWETTYGEFLAEFKENSSENFNVEFVGGVVNFWLKNYYLQVLNFLEINDLSDEERNEILDQFSNEPKDVDIRLFFEKPFRTLHEYHKVIKECIKNNDWKLLSLNFKNLKDSLGENNLKHSSAVFDNLLQRSGEKYEKHFLSALDWEITKYSRKLLKQNIGEFYKLLNKKSKKSIDSIKNNSFRILSHRYPINKQHFAIIGLYNNDNGETAYTNFKTLDLSLAEKITRPSLFSTNSQSCKIHGQGEDISVELVSNRQTGIDQTESVNGLQAIIDKLIKVIHVHHVDSVNYMGWARLMVCLAKGETLVGGDNGDTNKRYTPAEVERKLLHTTLMAAKTPIKANQTLRTALSAKDEEIFVRRLLIDCWRDHSEASTEMLKKIADEAVRSLQQSGEMDLAAKIQDRLNKDINLLNETEFTNAPTSSPMEQKADLTNANQSTILSSGISVHLTQTQKSDDYTTASRSSPKIVEKNPVPTTSRTEPAASTEKLTRKENKNTPRWFETRPLFVKSILKKGTREAKLQELSLSKILLDKFPKRKTKSPKTKAKKLDILPTIDESEEDEFNKREKEFPSLPQTQHLSNTKTGALKDSNLSLDILSSSPKIADIPRENELYKRDKEFPSLPQIQKLGNTKTVGFNDSKLSTDIPSSSSKIADIPNSAQNHVGRKEENKKQESTSSNEEEKIDENSIQNLENLVKTNPAHVLQTILTNKQNYDQRDVSRIVKSICKGRGLTKIPFSVVEEFLKELLVEQPDSARLILQIFIEKIEKLDKNTIVHFINHLCSHYQIRAYFEDVMLLFRAMKISLEKLPRNVENISFMLWLVSALSEIGEFQLAENLLSVLLEKGNIPQRNSILEWEKLCLAVRKHPQGGLNKALELWKKRLEIYDNDFVIVTNIHNNQGLKDEEGLLEFFKSHKSDPHYVQKKAAIAKSKIDQELKANHPNTALTILEGAWGESLLSEDKTSLYVQIIKALYDNSEYPKVINILNKIPSKIENIETQSTLKTILESIFKAQIRMNFFGQALQLLQMVVVKNLFGDHSDRLLISLSGEFLGSNNNEKIKSFGISLIPIILSRLLLAEKSHQKELYEQLIEILTLLLRWKESLPDATKNLLKINACKLFIILKDQNLLQGVVPLIRLLKDYDIELDEFLQDEKIDEEYLCELIKIFLQSEQTVHYALNLLKMFFPKALNIWREVFETVAASSNKEHQYCAYELWCDTKERNSEVYRSCFPLALKCLSLSGNENILLWINDLTLRDPFAEELNLEDNTLILLEGAVHYLSKQNKESCKKYLPKILEIRKTIPKVCPKIDDALVYMLISSGEASFLIEGLRYLNTLHTDLDSLEDNSLINKAIQFLAKYLQEAQSSDNRIVDEISKILENSLEKPLTNSKDMGLLWLNFLTNRLKNLPDDQDDNYILVKKISDQILQFYDLYYEKNIIPKFDQKFWDLVDNLIYSIPPVLKDEYVNFNKEMHEFIDKVSKLSFKDKNNKANKLAEYALYLDFRLQKNFPISSQLKILPTVLSKLIELNPGFGTWRAFQIMDNAQEEFIAAKDFVGLKKCFEIILNGVALHPFYSLIGQSTDAFLRLFNTNMKKNFHHRLIELGFRKLIDLEHVINIQEISKVQVKSIIVSLHALCEENTLSNIWRALFLLYLQKKIFIISGCEELLCEWFEKIMQKMKPFIGNAFPLSEFPLSEYMIKNSRRLVGPIRLADLVENYNADYETHCIGIMEYDSYDGITFIKKVIDELNEKTIDARNKSRLSVARVYISYLKLLASVDKYSYAPRNPNKLIELFTSGLPLLMDYQIYAKHPEEFLNIVESAIDNMIDDSTPKNLISTLVEQYRENHVKEFFTKSKHSKRYMEIDEKIEECLKNSSSKGGCIIS